jgi:vacuolar-type H+-ATPase subunit F/Vma7
MAGAPVSVEVRQDELRDLIRALRAEDDGKVLRKEMAKALRDTLRPHAERAKNAALSIPSGGAATSPKLRPAIARSIQPRVNMTMKGAGASIRARRTPRIRNFSNAPKRTNSRKGWRTQSWGNDKWRVQMGKVDWFDNAMRGVEPEARAQVKQIVDEMAHRIASRAGG